jgi:F-box and WD-40 domain protein 1/11
MGGFSIIGAEEAEFASDFYGSSTSPFKFGSLGRRAAIRSTPALNYFPSPSAPSPGIKSLIPRLWDTLLSSPSKQSNRHSGYNFSPMTTPQKKGKQKASRNDFFGYDAHVDYTALPPLDGEEGELVDDEACFVAVDFWGIETCNRARVVTGIGAYFVCFTSLIS